MDTDENYAFIEQLEQVMKEEGMENIQGALQELHDLYTSFSNLSNRLIRVFRRFMPDKRSKIGLSHFVYSIIEEAGCLAFDEIVEKVKTQFEYDVTNKSITDSLYYLSKHSAGVVRRFDHKRGEYLYRLKDLRKND